jgi:hypothetical protein
MFMGFTYLSIVYLMALLLSQYTILLNGCTWNSVVGIVIRLRADRSGVRIPAWAKRFLLTKMSRPALESNQPLIQRVPNTFPPIKRPVHEADHSPPSRVEVKNGWSRASAHPLCLHGVDKDYFTFNFTLE